MNDKPLIKTLYTSEQSSETPQKMPEVFADGAEVMLGVMITKISFYSISDVEQSDTQKSETREMKLKVTMPTHKFFELCANVVTNVKANESELLSALKEIGDNISLSLSSIRLVNENKLEEGS